MAADYNGARSNPRPALHDRLSERGPLVLDGATGTELQRRGVRATLPLWSSWGLLEAPDVVRAIHADYVRAGVDVLTAGAAGAWLHASAASFGPSRGFVASDLLEHLPDALAALG